METVGGRNDALIAKTYRENYSGVLNFIASRINNVWDAENLTQDVWLRLLTCGQELAADTIIPFIYTIARNLVNDYLRHYYHVQAVNEEMACKAVGVADTALESEVSMRDLAAQERRRVECLPTQRRIIYIMSRYEDKSVDDIADELSLSFRTVENHLRLGRRDVRSYIRAIA